MRQVHPMEATSMPGDRLLMNIALDIAFNISIDMSNVEKLHIIDIVVLG